ncbi:hypothetical protein IscW_ISCW002183 [Ixodes scapularis]|uniref:Uncharacterized protein n=1 Tax=Ixodes scapularis TaxID=6945 RepID=B7PBQ5_IXOSC|nr:hypothetical protein IscW_ISCW002183 [Ixodes scapularis]|eukprot:XP_002408756.1 hypothetical protein IscW_ISCW002183 [Ixodes scapularis]
MGSRALVYYFATPSSRPSWASLWCRSSTRVTRPSRKEGRHRHRGQERSPPSTRFSTSSGTLPRTPVSPPDLHLQWLRVLPRCDLPQEITTG